MAGAASCMFDDDVNDIIYTSIAYDIYNATHWVRACRGQGAFGGEIKTVGWEAVTASGVRNI